MQTIAVVILNWNGLGLMRRFIPGIVSSCRRLSECEPQWKAVTVIADNGSDDGSAEWMKTLDPEEVRTIFFGTNYGFTGGYNRALSALRDEGWDWFVLLNSDIEADPQWLVPLARWADSRPECGIMSPKLLSYDRRDCFEYAGAAGGFLDMLGFPFCRGRVMGSTEKDCGQYDFPREIFWATGAALMIRRELYFRCGGLDESFFAHMEEIDLCWRAKLLGTQVWNVPESVVYHIGGGALPNNSPKKLYLNFRNNLLMLYKNLPERGKGLHIFVRMLIDGAAGAVYLLTGKPSYTRAVIRAHRDYRRMKKDAAVTPGTRRGLTGMWNGTILNPFRGRLRKFLNLGKIR